MVHEGDVISISGTTGEVVLGEVPVMAPEAPSTSTRSSAGPTRSAPGSSRCGPTPTTAPTPRNAREFGAEGIGLCRTEHMFLGEDRLPIVRRMILADTPSEEDAALEELRVAQKADFVEILEAMDGLPVTVRLLDPPLHEFLPDHRGAGGQGRPPPASPTRRQKLFDAAKSWHEFNPMLGTRGVRLGVIKPGLYAMQVRALMEAAAERVQQGRQAGRRDHDPAHRHPRRAGRWPGSGCEEAIAEATAQAGKRTSEPSTSPSAR